jgi:hypothetical protein
MATSGKTFININQYGPVFVDSWFFGFLVLQTHESMKERNHERESKKP